MEGGKPDEATAVGGLGSTVPVQLSLSPDSSWLSFSPASLSSDGTFTEKPAQSSGFLRPVLQAPHCAAAVSQLSALSTMWAHRRTE